MMQFPIEVLQRCLESCELQLAQMDKDGVLPDLVLANRRRELKIALELLRGAGDGLLPELVLASWRRELRRTLKSRTAARKPTDDAGSRAGRAICAVSADRPPTKG